MSGFSGYSGQPGAAASSGFSGYSGYSGGSGYSGLNGTGTSGFSGISGYSGISGLSGYSGYSGSGVSGFSGATGPTGTSGFSGYSGTNGTSGYSGVNGASGTSGYSGSGVSGYSGFSGYSGVAPSSVANLSGGATGSLPYQSSANNTAFLSISGQTGNVLVAGATTPTYTAPSGISGIGSANNLVGGAALQIPYQSAANTTTFSPTATVGSTTNPGFLAYNGTGFVWSQWKTYLTSTNINTALGYTAADAAGSNASGTWPINVTGNATTATRAGSLGSGGGTAPMIFTYNGNASNVTYVWGTNGGSLSQNELYTTNSLSVGSATTAASISSTGGLQNMIFQNVGSLTVGYFYNPPVPLNGLVSGIYTDDPTVYSGSVILSGTWRLLGGVTSASVQLYVRVY